MSCVLKCKSKTCLDCLAGDLAVLLGAGWPVRRLALFSFLSTLLGFVGLLTGTLLGHNSPWVLTFTAGVFLYVALVDMVTTDKWGEGSDG